MPKTPVAASRRSLTDFVLDAKRAKCPLCQLPTDVRAQIRAGRENDIPVATITAWLKSEHGVDITLVDFSRHNGGRHDA